MSKVVRVAVTGAAGRVTSSLIVRLTSGEVFGPDTQVILQLLELPVAMKNLEGAMYELQDCGFSTLKDVIITDDAKGAAEWHRTLVTAGHPVTSCAAEELDPFHSTSTPYRPDG